MNIDILNAKGKKAGSIELPSEIFDVDPNIPLMHQVVVAQLASARQGTHATKTRGQVRGGGKKPWRQKGTGRARHGSIRSPQWRGGGVVFGPQPRSYKQRTPKKMKAAALRCALSDRARHDRIFAVEAFIEAEKPSTKVARQFLEGITENKKVLVVVEAMDSIDVLSLRNLPQVKLLTWGNLNTYDVLDADDVIFVKDALAAFIEARTGEEAKITKSAAKKSTAKKSTAKKAPAKKTSAKKDKVSEGDTKSASKKADDKADKSEAKKADDEKATADKAKDSKADEDKAKASDLKEKAEKKADKAEDKADAKADDAKDAKDEEASK